jgi:hypothetical protein
VGKRTNLKECYCYTCDRAFHYLGIARHRKMHKEKHEDCKIGYTNGDTYNHRYSEKKL